MRIRKKTITLITIFNMIFILTARSQETGLTAKTGPDMLFRARLSGEIFTPADRFANSQYYFENWVFGSVTLVSGETVSNQQIQYNAYMDELFWLHPELLNQVRLDKGLITGFETVNDRHGRMAIFRKLELNNDPAGKRTVFARLLHKDSVSLYSHRIFRESSKTESSMVGNRLVSRIVLMNDHRYFLEMPDGTIKPVARSRRSLYNAFPEIRQELRAGFRRERNRIRNEEGFIRAVALVNQLL